MKSLAAVMVVLVCLAGTGCTTGVVQPEGKIGMTGEATLTQVTDAIQQAGNETGWQTKVVRPGLIEGHREWGNGKHNMTVEVVYDAKTYSIKYKDSKNLGYDGTTVHRQYWIRVQMWEDAIKARTWKL